MARLPANRRVRTVQLHAGAILATGVPYNNVIATFTFQDDVTIIGASLASEFLIQDAHANADGQYNLVSELTRQSRAELPGTIVNNYNECCWTAAIVIPGQGNRHSEPVMFPAGYGIEVDEGEVVNVYVFGEWVGAGGDLSFYADAIIYYVER